MHVKKPNLALLRHLSSRLRTQVRQPLSHTPQHLDEAMSQASPTPVAPEIDVRPLVPAQRHARIFELVAALTPGGAFVLVNDHDPKPLYYQLEAEYPRQFSWTYVENGPRVWRVEIRKLARAA